MSSHKKELIREYKQTPRPMGVFQIRNLVNDKVLIVASLNLPGTINKHQFQLKMGGHPNRALQTEWHEFGAEKFAFEILDELTPRSEPDYDYREDLLFLEDLWLDKVQPFGERGYNEKKKTREQRLQMIMQNRRGEM